MTEPESQMKARLTFQKKPHATFSCIFFILEPVRGTTSGCKHIHETTADMVAQHAFSRTCDIRRNPQVWQPRSCGREKVGERLTRYQLKNRY